MKTLWTRTHAAGISAALALALAAGVATTPAAAQSLGWQARWDGGLVDAAAQGRDIAEGSNGNIYATGGIWNGTRRDLLTLAWNPAGELLWYHVKDGLNDSNDEPAHLIVDGEGHVIVVGTATRSTASWILTVAYDAAGNELWSRTNKNPAYRWNVAQGVAVDADGRVVVVGAISNGTTRWTSLVAYDSTGDLLWERQRDLAPESGSVAMAPTGVLAVAGKSNGYPYDFLTVAFDPGGEELWARSRDAGENRNDSAYAVVVDASGRFVVTGIAETAASGNDILTVAYDGAGNELWAAIRSGSGPQEARLIAADASGNVFVAGAPSSGFPNSALLIVSYDSGGLERWAVTVPDAVGESSTANDMTVSADGNVVVTGTRLGVILNDFRALTLKISGATGAELWTRIRTPAPGQRDYVFGVAPGATGSLFVIGSSVAESLSDDVLAIAYDSSGEELWVRDEPEVPADDVPGSISDSRGRGAIATGYDGRVYVTGTSFDGKTLDYMTVAYAASGYKIWEARKSNPNGFQAFPAAIAVDPATGNVYVTGTTRGSDGSGYLTVAYDRSGAEIWSRTRQGEAHGSDSACCIAVTPDGLILVTGSSDTNATYTPGMLTVAYERGGNEVWSDEWGPGLFRAAFTTSLTVGTTGTVYVGGSIYDQGGPAGTLTLAYDALGSRLWWASHNADDEVPDFILALAPTPDGGVAATGYTDPYVNANILTLMYGPDGTERWVAVADGAASGWDAATAITVDAAGQAFVTGSTYKPDSSDPDFITLAYDASGGLLWSQERGGIAGNEDFAGTLALGSHGTLFVTGSSNNGMNLDFLTVAYSPGGYELFEHRYDGGGDDRGYLAIAGPDGSAFIGGVSDGADRDFFVYQLFDDTGLFVDGFVSGDTAAWSATAP